MQEEEEGAEEVAHVGGVEFLLHFYLPTLLLSSEVQRLSRLAHSDHHSVFVVHSEHYSVFVVDLP